MRKSVLTLKVIIGISFVIFACSKSEDIELPDFLGWRKPAHFPDPTYRFSRNQITQDGFELGRKLFYDPILSRDNSISCGSCHISQHAFTHHGHDVSHGIDDRIGRRNSLPLFNLAWARSFFWDGGVAQLDLSPIVAIEDHTEMDESLGNVLYKLNASNAYRDAFKNSFQTDEIGAEHLLKALSQFMLMLVSDNSKYDRVIRREETFTEEEARGYALFKTHCNNCHTEPLFTDYSYRSNGIGPFREEDLGRFEISQLGNDQYRFKVPTLRNLGYTAPYMHDGRYINLPGVLRYYQQGQRYAENIDPLLVDRLPLSDRDVADLLTFLTTLDDEQFVRNPLFTEQP